MSSSVPMRLLPVATRTLTWSRSWVLPARPMRTSRMRPPCPAAGPCCQISWLRPGRGGWRPARSTSLRKPWCKVHVSTWNASTRCTPATQCCGTSCRRSAVLTPSRCGRCRPTSRSSTAAVGPWTSSSQGGMTRRGCRCTSAYVTGGTMLHDGQQSAHMMCPWRAWVRPASRACWTSGCVAVGACLTGPPLCLHGSVRGCCATRLH
mmetsp:Transcript_26955/g.58904  ORF Transcript_26955/g.58904 Transcript_26955/m.58904 type:complete len:206 (+) Transcript_26955:703-1320(+)